MARPDLNDSNRLPFGRNILEGELRRCHWARQYRAEDPGPVEGGKTSENSVPHNSGKRIVVYFQVIEGGSSTRPKHHGVETDMVWADRMHHETRR
jgi:hypothetical protein